MSIIDLILLFCLIDNLGNIMIELLWYYQPHQSALNFLDRFENQELFASKHYDVIDANCIEEKCYVLTFNEYCRYVLFSKFFYVETIQLNCFFACWHLKMENPREVRIFLQ